MTRNNLAPKLAVRILSEIQRLAEVMRGIPVWDVLPDSAAELAGVRFGDIIVSVNGVATPTYQAFLKAGKLHLEHLEFEVFRGGKLLRLSCKSLD